MRTRVLLTVLVVLAAAWPLAAQQSPQPVAAPPGSASAGTAPPAVSREAALRARYQLRVMEGVLENAVQHGIRTVATQMRLVTPDLIFFGSPSRARGFRLDSYGVFFDVEVPTLRPSVTWSVRQLTQVAPPDVARAIKALRRIVESESDVRSRREAEQALRLVELQVNPLEGGHVSNATIVAGDNAAEAAPAAPPDPAAAYESEVKRALMDAMLDYGSTLSLREDDWLAVAARANDAGLGEGGVEAATVLMKIRGRDLEALRAAAISRDVARARIIVSEF
jgi:hypothetical protein